MPSLTKPDGQRRRRNVAAHQWRYLPDGPSGLEPPPMPAKVLKGAWSNEAKRAWAAWWNSPMAHVWTDADTVALRRALLLVNEITAGRSVEHGALTALEDRLGLTPKARRMLQWEIDRATAAAPAAKPKKERTGDPRLRMVGGS